MNLPYRNPSRHIFCAQSENNHDYIFSDLKTKTHYQRLCTLAYFCLLLNLVQSLEPYKRKHMAAVDLETDDYVEHSLIYGSTLRAGKI
jgi:hypothetical protein